MNGAIVWDPEGLSGKGIWMAIWTEPEGQVWVFQVKKLENGRNENKNKKNHTGIGLEVKKYVGLSSNELYKGDWGTKRGLEETAGVRWWSILNAKLMWLKLILASVGANRGF